MRATSRIFAADLPISPSAAVLSSSGVTFALLSWAISSLVSLASDGEEATRFNASSRGAILVRTFLTVIAAPSFDSAFICGRRFLAYRPSEHTSVEKLPPDNSQICVSTAKVSLSSHITSVGLSRFSPRFLILSVTAFMQSNQVLHL